MAIKTPAIDQETLQNLPAQPGVYLFKNRTGQVIYVGKAKNLRQRVRSYFQPSRPFDPKTSALLHQTATVETILVDSEVEALILEANLIKQHRPRYNVFLRDDKSYPYIRITNEPYPRVMVTRKMVSDGSRYLGPYTDVKHLRNIIKTLRRIFPIRSCKYWIDEAVIQAGKIKLCLDYHIHRCQGPCQGLVSRQEYQRMIRQVEQFLKGKTRELLKELNERMQQEARRLNFEEAARLRDQIRMIENYYFGSPKVVLTDFEDRDVIALATQEEDACAVVFQIRDGKVIGRQHFYLEGGEHKSREEILSEFIKQYYIHTDTIPPQLVLPFPPAEDRELVEAWLTRQAQQKVELLIPRIGEKKKLIELTQKNAQFLLKELLLQKSKRRDYVPYHLRELQTALHLDTPPRRIEAFDVSNIQGQDAVASMVCFINGKPRKSEYRIFTIRSKNTPDDFAMIREAVHRRYKRLLEDNLPLPDLILIDGGKGQLNSALDALQALGIREQPIVGLAKRLEEVYLPGIKAPQNIPKNNAGLRLLQQIRDESHRFAITHFRKRHQKRAMKSPLDEVAGIGPRRKAFLLKTFGSLKKIQAASLEELRSRGKLPENVARNLYQFFHPQQQEQAASLKT